MTDPLSLLRKFTAEKKKIRFENDLFIFENTTFEKDAKTTFCSQRGAGEPYSLHALWFVFKRKDSKWSEYIAECQRKSIPTVKLVDRREIINYLEGEINSCASISQNIPLPSPIPRSLPPTTPSVPSNSATNDISKEQSSITDKLHKEKDSLAHSLDTSLSATNQEETVKRSDGLPQEKVTGIPLKRDSSASVTETGGRDITGQIMTNEIPLETRNSILKSTKKTFTSIIDTINRSQSHRKRPFDHLRHDPDPSRKKHRPAGPVTQNPRPPTTQFPLPIVIIPSASSSLLSLLNVTDFFENGRFVPSQVLRESGQKKPMTVTVSDPSGRKYLFIDNIVRLKQNDWSRVVSTFALGPAWQFKTFFWNEPVDLFTRTLGFFLKYEDELTPSTIASWDVKILTISKAKTKQHLTKTAANEFWTRLDQFIRSKKRGHFSLEYYDS